MIPPVPVEDMVQLFTLQEKLDHAQTPIMTAALRWDGAGAHYAIYPGGHSWNLWVPASARC